MFDYLGCKTEDSVKVTIAPPSIDLGEDVLIEEEQQIEIVAETENAKKIVWSDGTEGSMYIFNPKVNNLSSLIAYAISDGGCKATDTITINALPKNNKGSFYISLYPNPASDFITIHSKSKRKLSKFNSIEIFTISGRKVYVNNNISKSNVFKLNIKFLKPGTYIAKVNLENTFQIMEFVKK
ncbi:MAG: T9SS type A sorting domain-containing protein [Bacteroidales bacterium]|nr:T9SS type A sorting domain-containing protein [Bacteroidales bacterium]